MKLSGRGLVIWQKSKIALGVLLLAHFLYIILLKWVYPPITITQFSNWVTGTGLKRDYVNMQSISPNARLAVIASEDQLFAVHNGFDIKSIQKALTHNEKKPNRIRGASTISQQVAKNVFLWQGRGWIRKGLEAYFTFMIEWLWGKERILDMYLNVVEMGSGVFGIEAASQQYFKKPAKKLSAKEAAMIAACLPNPKKYKVKPASGYILGRYPWVLKQMNNLRGDKDIDPLLEDKEAMRYKPKK